MLWSEEGSGMGVLEGVWVVGEMTTFCDGTICSSLQFVTVARFVTTECFDL